MESLQVEKIRKNNFLCFLRNIQNSSSVWFIESNGAQLRNRLEKYGCDVFVPRGLGQCFSSQLVKSTLSVTGHSPITWVNASSWIRQAGRDEIGEHKWNDNFYSQAR